MKQPVPWLLKPIIAIYIALGIAYAIYTPTWQIPDEPAHYNYIADLARTGRLPILKPGDYPFAYLEEIKHEKFPPSMSIDSIAYEAWQPPLYYALAVPLFLATGNMDLAGQVIALRLISVVAGAGLLYLTYLICHTFLDDRTLALTTTVLVGFIPMHVAMTAAVNNDLLAEVIIAGMLLVCVLRLSDRLSRRTFVIAGGTLYGLGLLTKGTVYPSGALLVAAEIGHWRMAGDARLKSSLQSLAQLASIAVLLSAWWFVRNMVVYGHLDIFGRKRHEAVVAGQIRAADWIATHGWEAYWDRALNFTFKSFWGVFGWMGVFMDQRIYNALLLLSVLGVFGFLLFLFRIIRHPDHLSRRQLASLGLLALSIILTAGMYVGYNFTFMQHQGRYLFPALIPIALFAALGFRELTPKRLWPAAPGLLAGGLLVLNLICLKWFIIPNL